jgi:predicted DNA-binding protein (MmcQ/YjbR family)
MRESPLERLAELCLALPGAERIDAGHHSSFRVRGKVFAYFLDDRHGDGIVGCWCKTSRGENRDWIAADPRRFYMPAYVGVRGWVGIRLDVHPVRWKQVGELVTDSYRLVAPRRLAAEISGSLAPLSGSASKRGPNRH